MEKRKDIKIVAKKGYREEKAEKASPVLDSKGEKVLEDAPKINASEEIKSPRESNRTPLGKELEDVARQKNGKEQLKTPTTVIPPGKEDLREIMRDEGKEESRRKRNLVKDKSIERNEQDFRNIQRGDTVDIEADGRKGAEEIVEDSDWEKEWKEDIGAKRENLDDPDAIKREESADLAEILDASKGQDTGLESEPEPLYDNVFDDDKDKYPSLGEDMLDKEKELLGPHSD